MSWFLTILGLLVLGTVLVFGYFGIAIYWGRLTDRFPILETLFRLVYWGVFAGCVGAFIYWLAITV